MMVLHNGVGPAYLKKGNLAAAVTEYRAALALKDNYTSHVNLGNIFYNSHNDGEAMKEYLQAIRLDNNN